MPDRWIDDHVGGEVTPRPGFEDELETTLRNAWSAEQPADAARRVPVDAPQRRVSRRPLVFAVGAAAALMLAVIAVAVTRDGGSSTVPADPTVITGAPVPTEPAGPRVTTVAPPASASISTSTVMDQAAAGSAFEPVCVDRPAQPASPPADLVVGTQTFGPLATTPALTIELPVVTIEPGQFAPSATQPPMVGVKPIPGGFLVVATAPIDVGSANGSFMAAVNLDGSVRWLRCGDDDLAPGPTLVQQGPGAAIAIVGVLDEGMPAGWQALALDDGRAMGSLADVVEGEVELLSQSSLVLAQSESVALFDSTTPGPGGGALMVALDLETLVATRVAQAAPAQGAPDSWTYGVDSVGRPAIFDEFSDLRQPVLVLVDGEWVDGAAAPGQRPPVVGFDVQMGSALRAVDGSGTIMWTTPDITRSGGEAAQVRPAGDVTVVRGCVDLADDGFSCLATATSGVRNADGAVLWQLAGDHILGPAADGYALIGNGPAEDGTPGGWQMIELATGNGVPGQEWGGEDTFAQGCCASYELHTERHGGVVIATNGQQIRVYYPADVDLSSATATLP